jgi:CHAD domain-containing protein
LAEKRLRFTEELADAMNSVRYLSLLERLSAAAQVPPIYGDKHKHVRGAGDVAQELLPELVGRQWKTLRRRVRKAGRHTSDKQLHRIRIASKQLRYAAAAASPVIGKPAVRTARRAEALQTILGEHHDAVAAEQWLERAARNGSGCDGYAAGFLTATERRRQTRLRHAWHGVWAEVATEKSTRRLR